MQFVVAWREKSMCSLKSIHFSEENLIYYLLPPSSVQRLSTNVVIMDAVGPKKEAHYATINWAGYSKGRPPYPPSLTNLIYNYRRQHSRTQWTRLVDIGAGCGIASLNYLKDFKIIHISDPSTLNEKQARPFLTHHINSQNLSTEIEISQSGGEAAFEKVGLGQADMAICATAAHFIDPDALVKSIGKMLKPGGTLAIYSYWFPSFPNQPDTRLLDAFAKTLDRLALKPVYKRKDTDEGADEVTLFAKTMERENTGDGTLDSIPLPPELFYDPVRVYINSHGDRAPYRALSRQFSTKKVELTGLSRVQPRDRIVNYTTGEDVEAEGWAFEADKEFIAHFLDTVRPLKSELSKQEVYDIRAEFNRVFDEVCPSGKVMLLWPVYVALATREDEEGGE